MIWKDKENLIIALIENRTTIEDGLTINQLCKEVLGIEIKKTRRERGGKRKGYYIGGMNSVDSENWEKSHVVRTQIKALLKRVRKKYYPGHQYHIVPWYANKERYFEGLDNANYKYKEQFNKDSENKFRGYRCVHILPQLNKHLLFPSKIRRRKAIHTSQERAKKMEIALAQPQEVAKQAVEDNMTKDTICFLRPTKEEIRKAIVELKREKRLPWKGYKPNYKGIAHLFGREIAKKIRMYGRDIETLYFGSENTESQIILKDIVICDFEKKDYALKYDWELLQYLANQQGQEQTARTSNE
jgi:hypothetical protein